MPRPHLALLPLLATAKLSCVNEEGDAVDWFFMYKHPRWADKAKTECIGDCKGSSYVYATSASPSAWTIGKYTVDEPSSLLGQMLAGVYDGTLSNYVFYNDQTPDGAYTTTFGHSKGFFAYDSDSAFWVQHSIPDFPNYVKDGYKYGSGQMWYGQHAFCMTLTPSSLNALAIVMRYANPQIFDHALADSSLTNVAAVANEQSLSGSTTTEVDVGWATLHLQGKASSYDQDMLDELTAPTLEVALASQSWLNSGGPIGGYCPTTGYNVTDVQSITLPPSDKHVTYVDHSKWAVSGKLPSKQRSSDGLARASEARAAALGWFCALDNNHVQSQMTRSGLAVCLQQSGLVGLMQAAASDVDGCGVVPPSPPTNCCYYSNSTCSAGQTCCSGSGKSYATETTCDKYGAKHGCVWASGTCSIPSAHEP